MTLTTAQKQTLKTHIQSNSDTNAVYVANDLTGLAALLNADASPAFTVWKTLVLWDEIGDKIDALELVGLTTAKLTQLQTVALIAPNGVNPSMQNRRDAFDQVFSAAGGNITRPALATLWKRSATRLEKIFATGTGSVASPATLVVEGLITTNDLINF